MANVLFVHISSDLDPQEFDRRLLRAAAALPRVPGLAQKIYGRNPDTGDVCGIYFFESAEALAAFRTASSRGQSPRPTRPGMSVARSTRSSIRCDPTAAAGQGAHTSRSSRDDASRIGIFQWNELREGRAPRGQVSGHSFSEHAHSWLAFAMR